MNIHNKYILSYFTSDTHIQSMKNKLVVYYDNPRVTRFLNEHIKGHVANAAFGIEQELLTTDHMKKLSNNEIISFYTNKFLTIEKKFIDEYVLYDYPAINMVVESNRRNPIIMNTQLSQWKMNPARIAQYREDPSNSIPEVLDKNASVSYADEDHQSTYNHLAQYDLDVYKIALNTSREQDKPFGSQSSYIDNRNIKKRTFRNGKYGENTVPFYERALYNRYYERDIDESTRPIEMDYKLRGYDMSDIHKIINSRSH